MAGINNYEKLFFGGSSSVSNPGYTGIGMQAFGPAGPTYQSQFTRQNDQGLGGQFEGSLSLKADSTFVPVF